MKKLIIAISVGLIGLIILISGSISGEQDAVEIDNTTTKQIEAQISNESTTTSTNTTKTTKTTKKAVKTTKKATVKKVTTASKQEYIDYAKSISGYNEKQMNCLIELWNHESGWNPNSVNKSSGACGIPQAHPCTIAKYYGSNTWQNQIRWGVDYLKRRYHNKPCEAWEHFKNHNPHWY